MGYQLMPIEHGWVISWYEQDTDGLLVDSSRTWLGCESILAQRGWGICGFQHSMDELSGGTIAEHG